MKAIGFEIEEQNNVEFQMNWNDSGMPEGNV